MNTCSNCKSWKRKHDTVVGVCSKILPGIMNGYKDSITVHDFASPDVSGMSSYVVTGQEFSCNKHTIKGGKNLTVDELVDISNKQSG